MQKAQVFLKASDKQNMRRILLTLFIFIFAGTVHAQVKHGCCSNEQNLIEGPLKIVDFEIKSILNDFQFNLLVCSPQLAGNPPKTLEELMSLLSTISVVEILGPSSVMPGLSCSDLQGLGKCLRSNGFGKKLSNFGHHPFLKEYLSNSRTESDVLDLINNIKNLGNE